MSRGAGAWGADPGRGHSGEVGQVFPGERRPRIDDQTSKVLCALGSGATDEAAARELGMSLRTYRRRVAELLANLGAASRFQAGRPPRPALPPRSADQRARQGGGASCAGAAGVTAGGRER